MPQIKWLRVELFNLRFRSYNCGLFLLKIYTIERGGLPVRAYSSPTTLRLRSIYNLTKLALDELHGLRAVLVDVLLVRVGIIAVAAVGIGRIAVRLDDAWARRRAGKASRTSGELILLASDVPQSVSENLTP